MNDFKFSDDSKYKIQNTLDYRLSIQLNLDGFSFLMSDKDCQVLKIQHHYTGSIEKTLEVFRQKNSLDELTRISFTKLVILINTNLSSLIPESLYDENYKSLLLSYSLPINEEDEIKSNSIKGLKSNILYKLSSNHQEFIKLFKNSPHIYHLSSVLLPYALRRTKGNGIAIYTAGKMLHICDFSNNELQFYNAFPFKDSKEMLFHILNTNKILNKNKGRKKVYYSGELNPESEVYTSLIKYLPEIQSFPNEFPFGLAGDLNENYFSNLLASLDCVS